jgi:hypothetical protein
MKTATALYVVIRDCCTSGNCFRCSHKTPYGEPARIEHSTYRDARDANDVAINWRQYNSVVIKREGA